MIFSSSSFLLAAGPLLGSEAGSRPGGRGTFLCFAKEKYPKERRPAAWVPCASLRGNLRCSTTAGSRANSPSAQTSAIPDPPPSALLGPARTGQSGSGAGTEYQRQNQYKQGHAMACPWGFRYLAVWYSSPTPLWMRRGAQGQTDQGKNLFERSELFLTPSGPSTAGCPQRSGGTQQPGSPFLCLLSFGEAKESELPPGNPRPAGLKGERPAGARPGKVGGGTTP